MSALHDLTAQVSSQCDPWTYSVLTSASAQMKASVQATLDTNTPDGEIAVPANALQEGSVTRADFDVTEQPCWQGRGGCRCRCHYTSEYSGSFFFWIFHGSANPFEPCNIDKCNSRRYALNLRVALGRFGLPVALIPSLQFIVNPGHGIQIRPSLQMQRTCNYTSQGFRALYMLEHGYDASVQKASDEQYSARWMTYKQNKLAEIKQLFHEGKVSHLDVDPSGATWLEVSNVPWSHMLRGRWPALTCDRNFYETLGKLV